MSRQGQQQERRRERPLWGCMFKVIGALLTAAIGVFVPIVLTAMFTANDDGRAIIPITVVMPAAPASSPEPRSPSSPNAQYVSLVNFPALESGTSPVNTNASGLPADISAGISRFLGSAAQAEIEAYQFADPLYADHIYAGNALLMLTANIRELAQLGMMASSAIDFNRSHFTNVRLINDWQIEIDACEFWRTYYYDSRGNLLNPAEGFQSVPQTIRAEFLDNGYSSNWYITNVAFYDPPAFC